MPANTTSLSLTSLTLPTTIDVSSGYSATTVTVGAADADSLIDLVRVRLDHSYQTPSGYSSTFDFSGSADSFSDGVSSLSTGFGPNSFGTYNVQFVFLLDTAGNYRFYYPGELHDLGIATSFQVTGGTADTTVPALTSLTLPGTVDVSGGYAAATATAGATDTGYGVSYVAVSLDRSYQAGPGVYSSSLFFSDSRDSFGDGVSSLTTTFGPGSIGTYNVVNVMVQDHADNFRIYGPDELHALGIATSFQVTSSSPTQAPEISVTDGETSIADGAADPIDFGGPFLDATAPLRMFTVQNDGTAALTTSGLVVPSGFTVIDPLASSILPGEYDTFTVQLDTTTVGARSGQISFATNDSDENPFTFSITGVVYTPPRALNHQPVITSDGGGDNASLFHAENSTFVTTVAAFDPDGDALSFALAGADSARFQLDPATHALSFVTAPDFEAPTDSDHNNSYVVQVRVTDTGGLSDTQTIVVNVTDVQFQAPSFKLGNFGFSTAGGGWLSDDKYPRELADVNADGKADIVGFGDGGVLVSLATGGGSFGPASFALNNFGFSTAGGGWISEDRYPRHLADVDGDHRADIVGFGDGGVLVSLATGGGFAAPSFAVGNFGFSTAGGGWTSDDRYPREVADVDGDGMADIVGFGEAGVLVSLATGGGHFAAPFLALNNFGFSTAGGGWTSDDRYPRHLADVNGDHRADIVGFGEGGVLVSLATGGGHFAAPLFALNNFGFSDAGGGWKSDDRFPRELADVDHDGLADIVGFGFAGVLVSHATGDGHFGAPTLALDNFGFSPAGGGWTSDDAFPRHVADINADGAADIVGFGFAGVLAALATDFHV